MGVFFGFTILFFSNNAFSRTINWYELLWECGGDLFGDGLNIDLECLKDDIQSNDSNEDSREWSPVLGEVYVTNNRKAVVITLTFDQEAVNILKTTPPEINYPGIGQVWQTELGMEVELLANESIPRNEILVFAEGSSMNPVRDTEAFDSCSSGEFCTIAQILWRNIENVEVGREYRIIYLFQNPLDGIRIQPRIQLSLDIQWICKMENNYLTCLDGDVDDYFGIETSFYAYYSNGVEITADSGGSNIWCWSSKDSDGDVCSSNENTVLENSVSNDNSDIGSQIHLSGNYYGAGSFSLPNEENSNLLPDFITSSVRLMTENDVEKYEWTTDEIMKMHSWTENIGEADWEGSHDDIEIRYYLSKGFKEDDHDEWIHVGTDEIQESNLELGDDPKHEEEGLVIQDYVNSGDIEVGKTYNIVVCADRIADQDNGDGDVLEMHKSNNCSTEAVFSVMVYTAPTTPTGKTWSELTSGEKVAQLEIILD